MTPAAKNKKDALLSEVLQAGAGSTSESALGKAHASAKSQAPPVVHAPGRPRQEPTIPFTLRLPQDAATLLQSLVADLQARAVRGELPRSEATIGRVVHEALKLYAAKRNKS